MTEEIELLYKYAEMVVNDLICNTLPLQVNPGYGLNKKFQIMLAISANTASKKTIAWWMINRQIDSRPVAGKGGFRDKYVSRTYNSVQDKAQWFKDKVGGLPTGSQHETAAVGE